MLHTPKRIYLLYHVVFPSRPVSKQKLSPEKVYHVLVAPCFDKKLEAVREEFYNSLLETRDVDCVLTSGSVLLFILHNRCLGTNQFPNVYEEFVLTPKFC